MELQIIIFCIFLKACKLNIKNGCFWAAKWMIFKLEAECNQLQLNVIIVVFILFSLKLSSFLFNEVLCFFSSQIFLLNILSFSISI